MHEEKKGQFFVIDGLDGSGKETQTLLLAESLREEGKQVHVFSYPRYGTPGAAAAVDGTVRAAGTSFSMRGTPRSWRILVIAK